MLIYHPSDKQLNIVKVKYFCENNYTLSDKKASPIPRTFWYTTIPIPEDRLSDTKYIYVASIKERDLYNMTLDEFHYKEKFNNIHQMLSFLKKKYLGLKYVVGKYEMIAIFQDITPISRLQNK